MNRVTLYYFRDEMEKDAFLSAATIATGLGATKAGTSAYKAFHPLTKIRDMTTAEKLMSKTVGGSPFSPRRMKAMRAAQKLTGAGNTLITKGSNNAALLDRAGDTALEMIF